MLVESLDDTLVVDGTKQPKGTQFEMRNHGAAMNAVAAGLVMAVERDVVNVTDENVPKAVIKDAARIAAQESEPGATIGDVMKGKKR